MPNQDHSLKINIHGFVVECRHPDLKRLSESLRHFKSFLTSNETAVPAAVLILNSNDPDYQNLPCRRMAFSTPRNVVYRDGGLKMIDYSGRGLIIEDKRNKTYQIISSDTELLREMCHLTVLSLWGQHCDRIGWLRIHAMAVSTGDTALVIMMPAGGGKSTLLHAALKDRSFGIIAEDIALIDRRGTLLPVPSPLGLSPNEEPQKYSLDYLWVEQRTEFGPKYRLDADYFAAQIENRTFDKIVFMTGNRLLNGKPEIRKAGIVLKFKAILREIVFGIGVYQGFEYVVNHTPWEVLKQIPVFLKRLYLALLLARRHAFLEFTLGRDSAENTDCLKAFAASIPAEAKEIPQASAGGKQQENHGCC